MKKELKKYLPWIVLLVIIISLSLWYVLSKRVTEEQRNYYEEKIEEAKTYIDAKQYSTGIEKYYEAVDIIPSKVEAYEGIISVLITKNRIEEGKKIIEESAKSLNGYDKSILYKIVGDGYYNMGKYKEAFDMYDMGLILGVKNMGLELMTGKVMLKLGYMDDAKKQFSKSGYEGDEALEANLLLSYIYSIDDVEKARELLSSLEPSDKQKPYYQEFSELLNTLDEDAKFNATKLSRIYINNGYPYLAILTLEPIKEEISEYLEGMYFLGRAYSDFGDYDKSVEALDGALTLGGMETEILWAKARAYFVKNDLDNTIKNYDSAIGNSGDNFDANLVKEYVEILLDNSQSLKAEALVKSLLLIKEGEAYLNILAVETSNELKESVKVEFYLGKLETLELTEDEEEEYLEWKVKYLYDNNGNMDEYLIRLLNIDKYNPTYYLFLAKSQVIDNETDLAIQSLEKAIEYDLSYEITEEASKLLSSLR